ncbi:MAG: MGDG synthase family glycosyltransferase, partial [Azovibrio sp.]
MSKALRILVLSVSAGAGHIRAAQSLCVAQTPGLELFHLDVLDLAPASFRKFYSTGYIKVVEKAPLIWAYLYQYTDKNTSTSLLDRFRQQIEKFNT